MILFGVSLSFSLSGCHNEWLILNVCVGVGSKFISTRSHDESFHNHIPIGLIIFVQPADDCTRTQSHTLWQTITHFDPFGLRLSHRAETRPKFKNLSSFAERNERLIEEG